MTERRKITSTTILHSLWYQKSKRKKETMTCGLFQTKDLVRIIATDWTSKCQMVLNQVIGQVYHHYLQVLEMRERKVIIFMDENTGRHFQRLG